MVLTKALRFHRLAARFPDSQFPLAAVDELSLPDGTRHAGSVVLGMPARQIEVRITNSSYQKLAP